ncbi:hypothetical protein K432DRAFT_409070 [Lepidopterella palustris CBS 459.81]|uniref:Uncharacterized protein n=1 Tax=Lepidopterella palustris CBS 459.81 TaxID=1314670 RepID=A0A8E2E0Z6_9PEZI|nr:hypothetical protein K432DRAFT_409070 [Lepidopterella palustris CBS 459.81]
MSALYSLGTIDKLRMSTSIYSSDVPHTNSLTFNSFDFAPTQACIDTLSPFHWPTTPPSLRINPLNRFPTVNPQLFLHTLPSSLTPLTPPQLTPPPTSLTSNCSLPHPPQPAPAIGSSISDAEERSGHQAVLWPAVGAAVGVLEGDDVDERAW